jgi:hypothetical protein
MLAMYLMQFGNNMTRRFSLKPKRPKDRNNFQNFEKYVVYEELYKNHGNRQYMKVLDIPKETIKKYGLGGINRYLSKLGEGRNAQWSETYFYDDESEAWLSAFHTSVLQKIRRSKR